MLRDYFPFSLCIILFPYVSLRLCLIHNNQLAIQYDSHNIVSIKTNPWILELIEGSVFSFSIKFHSVEVILSIPVI
jgi:hypothetical protein